MKILPATARHNIVTRSRPDSIASMISVASGSEKGCQIGYFESQIEIPARWNAARFVGILLMALKTTDGVVAQVRRRRAR